ncbi:MAG TPA: MarR family winged helix-turn-helix transcriptional regulator [Candidatus Dorea gallistercoris]|uniref:MarR family winged helix-turn-helix transcriptional regulator n=1 Tax=Candidatus Dorea gallistercoris TaxID=2838542 RepID=A0A9D1RB82_9FIRM|nr:MarR family winged helix-turn-helix transcriptional regulator [Candidatus Dorea gallistercoris]
MVSIKLLVENIVKIIPEFEYQFGRPMKLVTKNTLTNYQSKILVVLQVVPEITMTDLADRLVMSKPQLTANVDVLVNLDFVERVFTKEDRRKINVRLTEKGWHYLEKTKKQMEEFYKMYYDRLTEEEQLSLYTAMDTLLAHLEKLNLFAKEIDIKEIEALQVEEESKGKAGRRS